MRASTLNLDLTKTEQESVSMFSKVPEGEYEVSLAYSQFKDGKKPGAAGLQIGYMIESGPQMGKMLNDYINIVNESEKAVEIGHKRLKSILVLQSRKSFVLKTDLELVSRSKFMISVVIEPNTYTNSKGETVEADNCVVKKLYAIEGVADMASIKEAQNTVTKTKAATKPAVTVVTPVAVDEDVATEEDNETPPWMRS